MEKEEKTYSKEVEESFERIIDTLEELKMDKVSVLTGNNGSGKSLIRKHIPSQLKYHLNTESDRDIRGKIISTSMDARTGSRPDLGALSGIFNDTGWLATSQNTFNNIEKVFDSIDKEDSKYAFVTFDEFEIGCGEETVLAIVQYINKRLEYSLKNSNLKGALVITHSRIGVENLKFDNFLNIDGLTKDEWLNREIVPTDLKKLDENELFFYIRTKNNES